MLAIAIKTLARLPIACGKLFLTAVAREEIEVAHRAYRDIPAIPAVAPSGTGVFFAFEMEPPNNAIPAVAGFGRNSKFVVKCHSKSMVRARSGAPRRPPKG